MFGHLQNFKFRTFDINFAEIDGFARKMFGINFIKRKAPDFKNSPFASFVFAVDVIADITFAEGSRTIAWQGALEREGKNGGTVNHSSDLSIVVDTVAHCRTRNGTAVTSFGDREIDTSFEDVKVCRDASGAFGCPTGQVTHTNAASGKQITVDFDGSDQATVTGPKGQTFEKPMICGS